MLLFYGTGVAARFGVQLNVAVFPLGYRSTASPGFIVKFVPSHLLNAPLYPYGMYDWLATLQIATIFIFLFVPAPVPPSISFTISDAFVYMPLYGSILAFSFDIKVL